MTGGNDDVVKSFPLQDLVLLQVFNRDCEVIRSLVISNISDHCTDLDVFANVFLVPPPLQVVKKNFSRWERRNSFSEMFFKCIMRKLQTFFWTVRPEISVHTTMDSLTMLV